MIESQAFMAVTSLFVIGFAWLWRVVASQKDRDARISDQLREVERLQIETSRALLALAGREGSVAQDDETRDRWIEGRFQHVIEVMREISERLAPDEAGRERVRRELNFLAERMVKLERAAPLVVRCDQTEVGDGSVRCPYCHGDLGDVGLVRCLRCQAHQHRECHESHGRCAIFGCGGTETGPSERDDALRIELLERTDGVRRERRARGA